MLVVLPALADAVRVALPFETARTHVQRQGMKSASEWPLYWVNHKKQWRDTPFFLPEDPEAEYEDSWTSWDDWLGVPLSYTDARKVVRSLGVAGQEHWWAYAREHDTLLLKLRVPSRPHLYYSDQWNGYDEWLGLESRPLVLPRSFLDN